MISLALACELKEAGLVWKTAVNDYFGLPERGMDDRVFVLSDMMANTDVFRGWPVVTFHGAAEWALDYILSSETVWLPREDQLRQAIEEILMTEAEMLLQLNYVSPTQYQCRIKYQGEEYSFDGQDGSEAYGHALLYLLQQFNAH